MPQYNLARDFQCSDLQPWVWDGLGLVTGEAHSEGVPGAPSDGLHVVFVLNPAGEGRHSPLPRLYGSVGFEVLVNEDKSPPCEVPLEV